MMDAQEFNKLCVKLLEVFEGMDELSVKWGQDRYANYRAKTNFIDMYLDDMKHDFNLSDVQHEALKNFTYRQHRGDFKK